jgi:hypothetical protein
MPDFSDRDDEMEYDEMEEMEELDMAGKFLSHTFDELGSDRVH